ncbi:hypothetical protein BG015_008333 [Linnemannia schmuckeri]|uniref:Shieldin complex subunit 2 first OB fold domain-containing protein n=1 Tax=Linnemannia schmuckeri TaxID=64567 RepID=A0A9P5VAE6_9FUNG|nr:hypothetical protein BG015_008333 [Linnemannia schmuckeri]
MNNTNNNHSPRRTLHQPATPASGAGQRSTRSNDESSDPISSPSPSPPPSSQVGLSVEVPDYLSTQFVFDNIQHFKSSDHLTPKYQQQWTTSNRVTPPSRRTDPHRKEQNISTPTRQRRSMARTLSDIIPDDISTQVAMQDIDQYRSTDHYRASNGSSRSTQPSPPQQDRVRIISRPHTTTTSTTSSTPSSPDSQEQPNKRRSALFSPFKPLFPPPSPPIVESKSPKRKSTPKKATPKKRQRQEFSVVDDTDPIEDGDSDGDWQVFWEAGKKDIAEGNNTKHHRITASPSTTPKEIQKKEPVIKTTKVVQQPTHIQQPTSVVLPIPAQKSALVQQPIPVQKSAPVQKSVPIEQPAPADPSTSRPVSSPAQNTIPLNPQVISFASKLTPIKHLSPNEAQRKYNIMGLIQLILPVQDGIRGFGGKPTSKAGLTICDKGSIHLNITLWGEKGKWVESCRVGDVVLLTDLMAKEYVRKTVASTRWSSMMFRMDGAALTKFRGDSVIEGHLVDLAKIRETLGHQLLDNDKYIARDPSLYQTLNASLSLQQDALTVAELPNGLDSDADTDDGVPQDEGAIEPRNEPSVKIEPKVKIEPEDDMKVVVKAEPEDEMTRLLKVEPEPEEMKKVKIEPGIAYKNAVGSKSTSETEVASGPTRGSTLRGVVVYHMLNVDKDDSKGWEIGVFHLTKNRLVKIQTSSYTTWIDILRPLRHMGFYGQWCSEDGVLRINLSSREPVVLGEKGPDVPTSAQRFESVKKVIDSRFMGIASVDGYIEDVTFPDHVMTRFWAKDSVFSIPLIVCSNCNMKMVPLQEDGSKFVCVNCQSDPDKRETSEAKWCYHDFHFWLKDKATLSDTQQTEMIRISCKGDVCQQVFPTIPAAEWSENIEKYQECRQAWITWMKMLAGKSTGDRNNQTAVSNARRRRVRVEIGVGKGRMGRALRVNVASGAHGDYD